MMNGRIESWTIRKMMNDRIESWTINKMINDGWHEVYGKNSQNNVERQGNK